jgi:hypothetical protein
VKGQHAQEKEGRLSAGCTKGDNEKWREKQASLTSGLVSPLGKVAMTWAEAPETRREEAARRARADCILKGRKEK